MPENQLTAPEVAEVTKLSVATIHRYRWAGSMPPPDGMFGRTPWWHKKTIDKWMKTRQPPGRPKKAGK